MKIGKILYPVIITTVALASCARGPAKGFKKVAQTSNSIVYRMKEPLADTVSIKNFIFDLKDKLFLKEVNLITPVKNATNPYPSFVMSTKYMEDHPGHNIINYRTKYIYPQADSVDKVIEIDVDSTYSNIEGDSYQKITRNRPFGDQLRKLTKVVVNSPETGLDTFYMGGTVFPEREISMPLSRSLYEQTKAQFFNIPFVD